MITPGNKILYRLIIANLSKLSKRKWNLPDEIISQQQTISQMIAAALKDFVSHMLYVLLQRIINMKVLMRSVINVHFGFE